MAVVVEERLYLGGMERYRRWVGNNPDPVEEIETHHLFDGEQRVLMVEDVLSTDNANPTWMQASCSATSIQIIWVGGAGNR